MMCGEWGASRCSPQKWFKYMGDANGNPYVPFQITYNTTDPIPGYIPRNPKIVPCNRAVDVSWTQWNEIDSFVAKISIDSNIHQNKTLPCACVDCEETCPVPPPQPPPPKPFTIFGLDGYAVIMSVVFVVLSGLFMIGACLLPSKELNGKWSMFDFIHFSARKSHFQHPKKPKRIGTVYLFFVVIWYSYL